MKMKGQRGGVAQREVRRGAERGGAGRGGMRTVKGGNAGVWNTAQLSLSVIATSPMYRGSRHPFFPILEAVHGLEASNACCVARQVLRPEQW